MPQSRKTVNVEEMRERANHALAYREGNFSVDYRLGVASMLETVLHAANRYRGFQYLDPDGETRDESRRYYL